MPSDIQYRDATFKRAAINEKARTIELSFSSSAPCERGGYVEILEHSPSAVDLTRLERGALLLDHDPSQVIGVIESACVTGKQGRAVVRFSKNQLAEEVWQDALDGIRNQVSVGYIVLKQVREADGESVRVTSWRPMEISIVAIAADSSVGIGRSHNQPQSINHSQDMSDHQFSPELKAHLKARSLESPQDRAARKIREYIGAVRNPAWKASAEAIGERMILQGCADLEEFRAAALETFTSTAVIDEPHRSEGGEYQHRTGGMNNRSVGAQIVAHRDVQQLFRGSKKSISFEIPGVANIRSLGTSDFGGSVQHQGAPVFENQRLTIADLLAAGTTNAGTVRYPRENSFEPAATSVGEAGQKPEQAFDVDPIDAPARKIAAFARISTELLQDAPAAAAYITSRLEFAVLREEERQILFGDGIGTNLTGIFTNAGVQTQPKGADTAADAIRKAIGNVAIFSEFEASGIVIHPLDWQNLELMKDLDGNYLVGNIFVRGEMGQIVKAPTLWGKPVVVTKSTPAGTALVGDFARAAQLFRRTGLLIEMSNQDSDNFTRNLVTVLAELRALVATYAPTAFCDVTGL